MKFISGILEKLRGTPDPMATYSTVQASQKPQRTSLLPPSQKKQQLAALQSGYNEMLDLTRSIRDHLASQNEVQTKISTTLEHLPETVSHLQHICRNADRQSEAIYSLMESTCQTQEMLHDSIRRSERRMALTLTLFLLAIITVIGGGISWVLPQYRPASAAAANSSQSTAPSTEAVVPVLEVPEPPEPAESAIKKPLIEETLDETESPAI